MKEENYRELVYVTLSSDSFINVNKKLVWILGIEASVFLSSLIYKERYYRKENRLTRFSDLNGEWFFSTQEDLAESTCLPFHKQTQCSTLLKKLHLIDVEKKQTPAKNFFKINHKKIVEIMEKDIVDVIEEIEDLYSNLNDLSLKVLMTSQKASFSLYKIINKNNKLKSFSSKEEKESDSDESLIPSNHIEIKRRNKPNKRTLLSATDLHRNNNITEKKSLQATGDVKDIFDFWLDNKLLLPKEGTKSYDDCIRNVKGLLNGRLFKDKYSVDQIKESILNFSISALDYDFEPSDAAYKKILSKKRIGEFIYSQFTSSKEKSLFQHYLKNKPKPIKSKEVVEDKYPMITNRLKRFYEEEVIGGAKVSCTQKDENCFRVSAIKLKDFYNKNSSRFNRYMVVHDVNLSDWLFESIKADCNGDISKISPGWFSSDTTFNRRFPAYLFRQNIIEERDNFIRRNNDFSKCDDLQINY